MLCRRGETDWPVVWGNREEQIQIYLEQAVAVRQLRPHLHTLFVTCGDLEAVQLLRHAAEQQGFTMYDKWQILEADPIQLGKVKKLDFDQLAIVDYEVMLAAEVFFGSKQSTFSAVIAYGRGTRQGYDRFEDLYEDYNRRRGFDDPLGDGPIPAPEMKGTDDTKLLVTAHMFSYLDYFP